MYPPSRHGHAQCRSHFVALDNFPLRWPIRDGVVFQMPIAQLASAMSIRSDQKPSCVRPMINVSEKHHRQCRRIDDRGEQLLVDMARLEHRPLHRSGASQRVGRRQFDAPAGGQQQLHRINVALAIRLHFPELCLLVQPLRIQHLNKSGVARHIRLAREP